jgi:hypothetical protein
MNAACPSSMGLSVTWHMSYPGRLHGPSEVPVVYGPSGQERIGARAPEPIQSTFGRADMMIALQKNARTTPAIRAEIEQSTASVASLA